MLTDGISVDEIIRDYYPSLTKEMIQEAIRYASRLVEGERYGELKFLLDEDVPFKLKKLLEKYF